jgi:hydrogenase/urease accessory protein HupE
MSWLPTLLIGLLVLVPGEAMAHLVSTRFGELYSGMLHPLLSLQHLVPWLALGLLGGLQRASIARWALLAFPLGILLGLTMAHGLPGMALVEPLNLLAFVILGLLVALKLKLNQTWFILLVTLLGLSQGYANAAPELRGFAAMLYGTGVGLAAYLLITLVSAVAHALATERTWGSTAVRAAGSWIAAAGAMYAGFLFTTA